MIRLSPLQIVRHVANQISDQAQALLAEQEVDAPPPTQEPVQMASAEPAAATPAQPPAPPAEPAVAAAAEQQTSMLDSAKEGMYNAYSSAKESVMAGWNAFAQMLGISEPVAREVDEHMKSCNWQKEGCLRNAEQGLNYETVALGGLSAPQIGGGAAISGPAKA